MECERCKETIRAGEERELYGQHLCEDCYIDRLSPVKACDPWAVYNAKSFSKGKVFEPEITETQSRILKILQENGGEAPEILAELLEIGLPALEREIATLRHLEKVRGEVLNGRKIVCLW